MTPLHIAIALVVIAALADLTITARNPRGEGVTDYHRVN